MVLNIQLKKTFRLVSLIVFNLFKFVFVF